jgi:hypothetical protein
MDLHLDPPVLEAFLAGRLSQSQEAALAAHLAAGECPDCERFLEQLSEAEERQLLSLLARVDSAPDLDASARQHTLARSFRRSWLDLVGWPIPVAAGAAAVAILLLFLLPGGPPDDPGTRIKGSGDQAPVPLTLSVGVVTRQPDGTTAIQRAQSGMHVPEDRSLVFQIRTEGRCVLSLVRADQDGNAEVLLPGTGEAPPVLQAGNHTPTRDGQPLGLKLAGLRGRQFLVATCSDQPLDLPGELAPLLETLRAGSRAASPVSYDAVILIVDPGVGP